MYVPAAVGLTVRVDPVAIEVPPQLPLYQCHAAPGARLPPVNPKVVLPPKQMVVEPVMAVAGMQVSLTVTVMLRQMVVLHGPSALTK